MIAEVWPDATAEVLAEVLSDSLPLIEVLVTEAVVSLPAPVAALVTSPFWPYAAAVASDVAAEVSGLEEISGARSVSLYI